MSGHQCLDKAECQTTNTPIEHDGDVGKLLKALDDLNIANNTIVIYTTDNGPNMFSWPDAAMTPFRSEKDTNWEGAFRVPAMIRWPGHIKPGQISRDLFSRLDWFPTLLANQAVGPSGSCRLGVRIRETREAVMVFVGAIFY
jgi:arylsulfatase A-like enzyme